MAQVPIAETVTIMITTRTTKKWTEKK